MKKFSLPLLFGLLALTFSSCEETKDLLPDTSKLSDAEIAEGLKEALKVGTDTASAQLSVTDGYFKDQAVKILLPGQVQNSIENFKGQTINVLGITLSGQDLYDGYSNPFLGIDIKGLKNKEDELVKGINRAAEGAASTAGPIFFDAIADITIDDANNILFGGNDRAATQYLEQRTSGRLFNEYEPKIDTALNTVMIGNTSVVETYESFVQDYNAILNTGVASSTIGSLMGIQTVQASDLSEHSTQKGLDGLFLKVAEEEEDIRTNPLARINSILEKVFGQLD